MSDQLATIEESKLVEFRALDTAELKRLLASAIDTTASTLLRLAAIVRVLEERGEDLSDLRFGLKTYLRQIAYGHLLPGVVVRFAEYPALMQRVGRLPLEQQRSIADGEPVPVLVGDDVKPIDPLRMTYDQVLQVFGERGLRDEREQREAIEDRRARQRSRISGRKYHVRVDRNRRRIVIGKSAVPIEAVLTALAEAAGYQGQIEDSEMPHRQKAHAPLTDDEKERLKAMARATGLSETEVVRRAILAWLI